MDPTPGFNRLFSLFSCTNKSKVNPDIDSYLHDMYFSILWFATQENKEGFKKKVNPVGYSRMGAVKNLIASDCLI